ncbi:MAG: peptidase A26, partial [Planctomycetes bacterium]|nr:peptidase A26 [Planctomycetota bacterium]
MVSGSQQTGGFIGVNTTGVIINCYATGTARGSVFIGGFVGLNHGPLLYCYSTGEVTSSTGDSRIGGFCGTTDAAIVY